jgi:hypothetical protein
VSDGRSPRDVYLGMPDAERSEIARDFVVEIARHAECSYEEAMDLVAALSRDQIRAAGEQAWAMSASQLYWLKLAAEYDDRPRHAREQLAAYMATLGDPYLAGLGEALLDETHVRMRAETRAEA